MKILIIGANGQLGSDCCSLFAGDNEIVGCDIPEVDIGSRASIDRCLDENRPEAVINCAAYTAVDKCESESELAWEINARGPEHLAKAVQRHNARLIHVSTDYVFDGAKRVPDHYLESDTTNPLSVYGKSKLAGEQSVQQYCANHLILRTAWLYSATGGNFLKTMLRLAVSDPDRELRVVDDQFGSLTWSYTLARQIGKLLDTDITGIAHATSEGYSSWYEAARYFLEKMEIDCSIHPCTTSEYPTAAHRPANSILENKVLKDAGLSLFTTWQEELEIFVEKFREDLLAEARPR
ncbi:dTDP-4-dehydrorhamnose reductase [Desulforhopalus singaporensis]|uniref:dTDP-4-dehydrorhamnose reductase n=1 Tax=Desulforhopalus singaporensis TaxID=91360 RepID=A0A1H0JM29_9BACT|nr:dTDP-4-dehydrorhamnose reductase [Desulforhopalus singaporensis]SDO44766.1 dTDP-4-dehydrorhamnose reductase [Desulforhopalus singaporensis]